MGRWEPNARGRLEQAAMELYREQGFDRTTVAEIATRAGLTERTFFRHFADKREVLFWGAGALQEYLVRRVEEAPDVSDPLGAIVAALTAAATDIFAGRREFARSRQEIIGANIELRERELVKLAALGAALADALRRRDVPDLAAELAADAGMTVLRTSFERWVRGPREPGQPLAGFVRAVAAELRTVAAPAKAAAPRAGTRRPSRRG